MRKMEKGLKKQEKAKETLITKDMTIASVVETYPEIIPALLETGVSCIGCHVSVIETLEQGLSGHGGYSEKQIEEIVEMLNKLVGLERGDK